MGSPPILGLAPLLGNPGSATDRDNSSINSTLTQTYTHTRTHTLSLCLCCSMPDGRRGVINSYDTIYKENAQVKSTAPSPTSSHPLPLTLTLSPAPCVYIEADGRSVYWYIWDSIQCTWMSSTATSPSPTPSPCVYVVAPITVGEVFIGSYGTPYKREMNEFHSFPSISKYNYYARFTLFPHQDVNQEGYFTSVKTACA